MPSTSPRPRVTPANRPIALGILHRLTATVPRVGVFRPITRLGEERATTSSSCCWPTPPPGCPTSSASASSYQQLHDDPDAAIADIVDRFHRVAEQCDAVLIVGSDYTDVASPSELSVNARIAVNLGAPVVLSVRAQGRTPEEVAPGRRAVPGRAAQPARAHRGVVANRCDPAAAGRGRRRAERFEPKSYVLPEEPLLVAPSVADLRERRRRHPDQG